MKSQVLGSWKKLGAGNLINVKLEIYVN